MATAVVFVAAVVEAVAVLGILLPGTPVLMAVAAAAGIAGLPMPPIMAAAMAGAVLGDGLSFWLGRRYGTQIRRSWPFASRPALLARADAFFLRFGAPSVAIARFLPVLRSTVPLVAGMSGMPVRAFVLANVLSAAIWAPLHVLPAQWAGVSLGRLGDGGLGESSPWVWAALAGGALVLGLIAWGIHRATSRMAPHRERDGEA